MVFELKVTEIYQKLEFIAFLWQCFLFIKINMTNSALSNFLPETQL